MTGEDGIRNSDDNIPLDLRVERQFRQHPNAINRCHIMTTGQRQRVCNAQKILPQQLVDISLESYMIVNSLMTFKHKYYILIKTGNNGKAKALSYEYRIPVLFCACPVIQIKLIQ